MKHAAPPPAMNTYRARLAEVQAFNLDDGRYLLATEPPRYMPMAEFEATYELVSEAPEYQLVSREPERPVAVAGRLLVAEDLVPASERLASTLAARTNGADVRPPRPPRNPDEIERVLEEVRGQVDQDLGLNEMSQHRQMQLRMKKAAKPGKGRKACPKCHLLSGARASECGHCGAKFVKK